MRLKTVSAFFCALALLAPAPVFAGWKLLPARQPVAVGTMKLIPSSDWNQAGAKLGIQAAAWTHDGLGLNALEFFGGVLSGQPLYKERSAKQNPMPKFDKAMLAPDLADLFERSFRVQHNVTDFSVDKVVPSTLGRHPAIAVEYRYSLPNDELKRMGVARLTVVNDKLFVANFHAPVLYYFAAGWDEASAIMDSASF